MAYICKTHDFATKDKEFYKWHVLNEHDTIKSLRHIGIVVSNIEQAVRFYERILGFGVLLERYENTKYFKSVNGIDAEAKTVKVGTKGIVLELMEYVKPKDHDTTLQHTTTGKMHMCFEVDNMESTYKRFLDHGVNILCPPTDSPDDPATVCTILDMDGNYIELVEIKGTMPSGLE